MPDFDTRTIDEAVEEFRAETMPTLKPAGLGPVRATVRRRRRTRTGVLAVVATVLGIATVATSAQVSLLHQPYPDPSVTATTRRPDPNVTSSTNRVPNVAVVPSLQPSGCARLPGNGVDVCNATLDIPALAGVAACPSGPIAFTGGESDGRQRGGQLDLSTVGRVDVDHDGVPDTIAIVTCSLMPSFHNQVLVFRSDGSLLGRVAATEGPISAILDVLVFGNGSIGVEVTSVDLNSWPDPVNTLQWRTYSWTGHAFAQTAGSTSFRADPTSANLTLAVAPIVFDKLPNGARRASVQVTVHNRGSRPAAKLSLYLFFSRVVVSGPGVQEPTWTAFGEVCPVGTLAAGGTWQRTLTFTIDPDAAAQFGIPTFTSPNEAGIRLTIGDQVYSELHTFTVTYR
jgi:hypothetical protein